jgi:transcription termination/antitermination protein NusG
MPFFRSKKPIDPDPAEVERIMRNLRDTASMEPHDWHVGDKVKVVEGPLESFEGVVVGIERAKEMLHTSINIFGRETPVELTFTQVEKL